MTLKTAAVLLMLLAACEWEGDGLITNRGHVRCVAPDGSVLTDSDFFNLRSTDAGGVAFRDAATKQLRVVLGACVVDYAFP